MRVRWLILAAVGCSGASHHSGDAPSSVDEITLMFGPPTHFYSGGRDTAGAPTINVEAGFWNPVSNTFYLPRTGGASYAAAWTSALGASA